MVDDNDINREVLARRLERQGHTTALAASGQEALDLVRAGKFDLVLLDVMMPEMNGYQVLQYMKADQALRDIPVIMISALDEIDSVVLCIEMGAEDYLPKPFNPVLLKARIDASLEKKRLRDQEIEYLQNAERVTAAAAAVEAGEFQPESLDEVAARTDALGGLAKGLPADGRGGAQPRRPIEAAGARAAHADRCDQEGPGSGGHRRDRLLPRLAGQGPAP